MGRFFLKSFLIFLMLAAFSIIFLSYFGLETDKFDDLIKSRANEVNKYVKIEFQKTKIHINPTELNLEVKLQNPKILVKNNEIILSKLNLYLPLRSFITSDFLLERAEISFAKNDIKDLTKITGIFLPKFINKKLNKIFHKGNLEGEFIIPFKSDGSIGKDYEFFGKVSEASINLTKEFSIKNLTTKISYITSEDGRKYRAAIEKGFIYDLELAGSEIYLEREKNKTKIKSYLQTNGKLDFSQIKKISSLFNLNTNLFKDINGTINLVTPISFDLDKQFKIKNLSYSSSGDIDYLEIHTDEKNIIKEYLPEYDPKIILKNTKISFKNSKLNRTLELGGSIKVGDKFETFDISENFDYSKQSFNINGRIELTNSKVTIPKLNYNKDIGKLASLNFDVNFVLNSYFNIQDLEYSNGATIINLSNIKLNKNFELIDFEEAKIRTLEDLVKNNDFSINKSKKIIILGEIFDAEPLLKSLYKKDDKKTFSKDFFSKIKINFDKVLTGTNDDISNFAMIASIKKGSYEKLSLKGNFSKDEIVEMSIYQIDKDKKTLQVISDRARPFVKNFDFIEGFEDGKLEYESIISKEVSNSSLTITDFKVSKVPALAQLLTLASLQGIADTLSGEGIRFESFEMKSNSEDNVLNIEDALAIGPAVSILLEGYVDRGKIVSLRGTLVPATKLNSIIASIPIVGEILVGKKTGEGVVGVSFKMKGPPKDIKTTVNPIKTLTPRFIVRALEKKKKNQKDKAK
jgi:hypothetical protein